MFVKRSFQEIWSFREVNILPLCRFCFILILMFFSLDIIFLSIRDNLQKLNIAGAYVCVHFEYNVSVNMKTTQSRANQMKNSNLI